MELNIIKEKIKQTVRSTDVTAQIILFGSRARGDTHPESDWDILILLNKPKVSLKDEQAFRHKLYDIELETGIVISTFVYSQTEWNGKMSVTPLYKNVTREGIYLCVVI
jgi:predicted nucleotidyltransferase